jgi:hypothetical protein
MAATVRTSDVDACVSRILAWAQATCGLRRRWDSASRLPPALQWLKKHFRGTAGKIGLLTLALWPIVHCRRTSRR